MPEEEKDQFEKINDAVETLKVIFGDSVHIETKTVKAGGTSNNVYVPKKFGGHPVTIIIWDKPNGMILEEGEEDVGRNREQRQQSEQPQSPPRSELQTNSEAEL